MTSQRQNTIVGIFALSGLAVLCALVLVFGGAGTFFSSTYDITIRFPDGVVGIQSGQGVTLYGKRVGETTDVQFSDPNDLQKGIDVVVAVNEAYLIPKMSKVVVARSIMGFGRPAIGIEVLDPLNDKTLPTNGSAVLQGEMIEIMDQLLPPEMQQALTTATHNIAALAVSLGPVADNLAVLLETRTVEDVDLTKVTANLATLIERFDLTLKNINALIGDERNLDNFRMLLANAKTMSDDGIVAMENLKVMSDDGKRVMQDAGKFVKKLAGTSDNLSAVLTEMSTTLTLLNEGKGSAGLFLNDNRLYEELVLSAKRMSKALDELREVLNQAKEGNLKLRMF